MGFAEMPIPKSQYERVLYLIYYTLAVANQKPPQIKRL